MWSSQSFKRGCDSAAVLRLALTLGIFITQRENIGWVTRAMRQFSIVSEGSVALFLGIFILVQRLRWTPLRPPPTQLLYPITVLSFALFCQYLSVNVLHLGMLGALFGGVTIYGLAGCWLPSTTWRRLTAPCLIILAAFPVGERIEGLFGIPARLAAANTSYRLFQLFGFSVDSAETILVFENGIADVAAPCSGLRGLWTTLVILIGRAALEKRQFGPRLACICVGATIGVMATNALRVATIVAMSLQLREPELAKHLHAPLGLAAFGVILGIGLISIAQWVPYEQETRTLKSPLFLSHQKYTLSIGLLVTLSFIFSSEPLVSRSRTPQAAKLRPPLHMKLIELPITDAERKLADVHQGGWIKKYRFTQKDVTGQVVFVAANSWRQQHPPELCLQMSGHVIVGSRDITITDNHQARILYMDGSKRIAIYWYQSPSSSSPSLWNRVFADWTGRQAPWLLVSILLETNTSSPQIPMETLKSFNQIINKTFDISSKETK